MPIKHVLNLADLAPSTVYSMISYLFMPLLLCSCAGYDITLNNRVIYTPPELISDLMISDQSLASCVRQTIEDQSITEVKQLKQLICTNAEISRLDGLEVFVALRRLKLSHNTLTNTNALAAFPKLEQLYLDNNKLSDLGALQQLKELQILDIRENDSLSCMAIEALKQENGALVVTLPAQCEK